MGRANKKNKSKVEEQVEVEDPEGAKASHKRKNVSPSSSPGAQRHKFQDKSQVEEIKKAAKTIEEIKKTEEVSNTNQTDNISTIANEEINTSPKRRKKLTSTQILDTDVFMSDTEPKDKTNEKVKNNEEGTNISASSPTSSPDSSPSHSPNSILRSPGKSPKIPKSPAQVKFQGVEIRQYNRCHGGSAGIPHQGAYPLGLDWSYDKNVMTRTVSDFEHDKTQTSISDGVHYLAEKDRKKNIGKIR